MKLSDLYNSEKSNPDLTANTHDPSAPDKGARYVADESSKGWGNQELADLYRAHRLLALAGIVAETDHGVTDEGDPWFIFMDARHEVFVHFCRYDGAYMVSSQVSDKPVWGNSLSELVVKFSEFLQVSSMIGAQKQNVVSIVRRSQDTVMIHPAAALAALIWSVYVMSESLSAAAPIADREADINPDHAPEVPSDGISLPEIAQRSTASFISEIIGKYNVAAHHVREANSGTAPHSPLAVSSQKAICLGLSISALSVGLPLFGIISRENKLVTGREVRSPSADAAVEKIETTLLFAEDPLKILSYDVAERHDETKSTDLNLQKDADALIRMISVDLDTIHAELISYVAISQRKASDGGTHTSGYAPAGILFDTHHEDQFFLAGPHDEHRIQDIDTLINASIVQRFNQVFESAVLSDLDMLSVSEFSQLAFTNGAADLIERMDEKIPTAAYASFDDNARDYLNLLLQTYDDIRIVILTNEIIFINMDAFEVASHEDPIYTRSWNFDDGGTISTVGLRSDMAILDHIV